MFNTRINLQRKLHFYLENITYVIYDIFFLNIFIIICMVPIYKEYAYTFINYVKLYGDPEVIYLNVYIHTFIETHVMVPGTPCSRVWKEI